MTMTSAQSASLSQDTDPRLRLLPAAARAKFAFLRRAEIKTRAFLDGLQDAVERTRQQRDHAVRALALFDRQHADAFTVETDEKSGQHRRVPTVFPERSALAEEVEGFKRDLQHLAEEIAAADIGYSTDSILSWLAAHSSSKFVAAPTSPVKLAKGTNLFDALSQNRESQMTLRAELVATQNARRTVAEAKAAMRREVASIAERGRPDVANVFIGGEVAWPNETLTAHGYGDGAAVVSATVRGAFAVALWANEPAVVTLLDAEIERLGEDANALTKEAQTGRVAELERSLRDLQGEEEQLIERLVADGVPVRRLVTDPLILLAIEQAQ